MKVDVLGCHGSDALLDRDRQASTCHTCGFLVNDAVLLDAGTVANRLSFEAQKQIRHVLLSHLHFDHIKGLPMLADNVSEHHGPPITVAALSEVIQGLRAHIFNTHVYPDFFAIPTPAHPVLTSRVLTPGKPYEIVDLDCTPILVDHTVPTAGFIIQDSHSAFVYSGDTAPTKELWQVAGRIPHLRAALIECSYPNEQEPLAHVSKHLTPRLLAVEWGKLSRPDIALYVYHLKPLYKDHIVSQLMQLGIPNLTVLEEGRTLEW